MNQINKKLVGASTSLLVLSVLAKDPSYGYQIIKAINHEADGLFVWQEGTAYPVLHKLAKDNLVRTQWQQADTGRRRPQPRRRDTNRTPRPPRRQTPRLPERRRIRHRRRRHRSTHALKRIPTRMRLGKLRNPILVQLRKKDHRLFQRAPRLKRILRCAPPVLAPIRTACR